MLLIVCLSVFVWLYWGEFVCLSGCLTECLCVLVSVCVCTFGLYDGKVSHLIQPQNIETVV